MNRYLGLVAQNQTRRRRLVLASIALLGTRIQTKSSLHNADAAQGFVTAKEAWRRFYRALNDPIAGLFTNYEGDVLRQGELNLQAFDRLALTQRSAKDAATLAYQRHLCRVIGEYGSLVTLIAYSEKNLHPRNAPTALGKVHYGTVHAVAADSPSGCGQYIEENLGDFIQVTVISTRKTLRSQLPGLPRPEVQTW